MPAMTVSTNVTAPHSRRSTAQFTSGKFYRDPSVAIRPDSFRPPPDVLSPTVSRRRVWEVGVPRGKTSVLTRALEIVVGGGAFLFLLLALVQESDEVLRPRERFPTLREEVLDQDLAVRLLVDGDAPLVEGARNFDLEVLLRGLIPNNFLVVESSSS